MLDGTETQKTHENAMFSMSFWGADARQKLPKPFGPARWLGKRPKMRFGCQKARAGFESKFKNREKTSGFCNVLQKANKSELQRMRKTKGPWRGRRNAKTVWKRVVLNTFLKSEHAKTTERQMRNRSQNTHKVRVHVQKKRAKTRGFCNGLQKSNKSELKRTQQNQRSVARPRKREKCA